MQAGSYWYILLFCLQLFLLYFFTKFTTREMFRFFRFFFKKDAIVFSLISFIYFPGTVIHELSHFIMATLLLLKVHEIHVFPEWEGNYLKLGHVLYEKTDVVRSVIVGIAPILIGLLLFWWLSAIDVLLVTTLSLRIVVIYSIFVISSTMFSSKQDLVDIIYLIPIIILAGFIIYIFQVNLGFLIENMIFNSHFTKFVQDVNIFITISLAIHSVIWLILRSLRYITRRYE